MNPGEILAARCTYNTTGHHTATKIGATGGDEMCNLYLMFYTLSTNDDFIVCADEQNAALTSQLPYGNDIPLPSNPALEHKASGLEEPVLNYNNGAPNQNMLPMPVKKGGNTVKKRPGVDTGSVKKKPGVEPNYGEYGDLSNLDKTVAYSTNNADNGGGITSFLEPSALPDIVSSDYGLQPRAAAYSDYQQGLVFKISAFRHFSLLYLHKKSNLGFTLLKLDSIHSAEADC